MPVLRLRADTEAALIEALPMLRATDEDGAPCWMTAGPLCDLDPIGPLALTAPVVDPETGEVTEPAVVDERFHANIRGPRRGSDPAEWAAIVEAAAPYTLSEVNNPRRRFML
ncbi:hypothetical protein FZ983_30400 [Azospirillum sp. B21]|uniref:hypothetical protein n=1 Tax=Azospirillum sp. B21 TaxID=2607496 RepID=UPI0011EC66DD|nr:hypothetical protein [Azospirillum sp. B21]KAA0573327.1 hypothetical protein FZ983_30400 [Azospirillum sp. B21]